jgi:hypothetical protein
MIIFSSCSIAANSLTCPSPTPRSHFPSIAIAVSIGSRRPACQAAQQPPMIWSRFLRVQILGQGAVPFLAEGDDAPQQRVRRPAEPG